MLYALGVIVLLLGIIVSIALHEVGHLLPAKKFGVRVPRYMIGFGPTLWSRTRGETEYGIKAFPLGGYIRMIGMVPPEDVVKPVRVRGWAGNVIADTRAAAVEELQPSDAGRAFYSLAWWKKAIIMAGGPVANLLIAVALFTGIGLTYGEMQQTSLVSSVSQCVLPVDTDRECSAADPVAPAALAGIEIGDRIVAVDGVPMNEWLPLVEYIREHPGVEVELTVLRDGVERIVPVTPLVAERPVYDVNGGRVLSADGEPLTASVGFLGVSPSEEVVAQGPLYGVSTAWTVATSTAGLIVTLPSKVWHAGRVVFGLEERRSDGVLSIVGVGQLGGEIASADQLSVVDRVAMLLGIIALLNIALFVFNMIPLTPLDGGHIAGAFWQGVKEGWARWRNRARVGVPFRPRPVDLARMMPATYVVFFLLIAMGAILIAQDVVSPL